MSAVDAFTGPMTMENAQAAFIIQDVPGKGKGVVATKNIASGELILLESPLFTQSVVRTNASVLTALSRLTDAEQREFFSFSNCHRGKLPPALGVFNTNALPCGDNSAYQGAVATEGGLFVKGSRFNSSCVPNVNNFWDERLRKIGFRALRDIAKGEELCISYGQLYTLREARRRRLKEAFTFDCSCEACSLSGDEMKASDERRTTLQRLYGEIGGCGGNPALGIRKVKLALRLLKEEGILEHHELTFLYDAFQFCAMVSDVANAKAWIRKAWEAGCRNKGADNSEVEKFATYLQTPQAHPAFGCLRRQKLSGPDF